MTARAGFYVAFAEVVLVLACMAVLFWFLTTIPYTQP